jgi:hypothetical protein
VQWAGVALMSGGRGRSRDADIGYNNLKVFRKKNENYTSGFYINFGKGKEIIRYSLFLRNILLRRISSWQM